MQAPRVALALKRVFTETFTVADIAEPLASFDADARAEDIRAFMMARDFDIVGIRLQGEVASIVQRELLEGGPCEQYMQKMDEVPVREANTPLLEVVTELHRTPFLLINVFGRVGGIVTRADLQKPPLRMWLFGLLTLIELRFTELIEQHCPGDRWKQFVSEARLQKAQALLAERSRRNQALQLLDCLQFSDKGQIVARNEEIRRLTVFRSRRQADEAIKDLEQLRNNLAHAQDILATDWETIIRLCEFITAPDAA
ncbi:MAG TPA: hypothetical protein VKS79_09355 [Gemmataceae bacterium]|nr:hypothetical protein [Gemmataceae bacterium]